jgi:hypothetical protein
MHGIGQWKKEIGGFVKRRKHKQLRYNSNKEGICSTGILSFVSFDVNMYI